MYVLLVCLLCWGRVGAVPAGLAQLDLVDAVGLFEAIPARDEIEAFLGGLGSDPWIEMASDLQVALDSEPGSARSKRSRVDLLTLMIQASEAVGALLDSDTQPSPGMLLVSYAMKATPAVLKVLSNNRTGDEDPVILLAELTVIGLKASPLVIQVTADMYNNTSPDPEQVSQLVDLAAEATPILVQLAIQESPDSMTETLSKFGPFFGTVLGLESPQRN